MLRTVQDCKSDFLEIKMGGQYIGIHWEHTVNSITKEARHE